MMIYVLLVFMLFNNIIFSKFMIPDFFNYWDEFVFFLIVFYWLFFKKKNNNDHKIAKNYFVNYAILVIICMIGLCGNVIFNFAFDYNAVLRDIVSFLKFPLAILMMIDIEKKKNINESKKEYITKCNRKFEKFIKCIIFIIFIFGIVSLFFDIGMSQLEIRNGIRPYQFLYNHPTVLVLNSIFLLALIETIGTKKNILYYRLQILIIIILTMRTKGIAFVSLYLFIIYFGKNFKKMKFIYIAIGLLIIFGASYSKLKLYASFSSSPREVLYFGAIKLLKNCFPFGSGFGTFASHISATYFSNAYSFINLPKYYLETPNYLVVLGDAGYPYYIAQFGFLGTILFFKLMYNIFILLIKNLKNKNGIIIIITYFLIALTSEATLINFGIEIAFMLLFVYRMSIMKEGN